MNQNLIFKDISSMKKHIIEWFCYKRLGTAYSERLIM